MPKDLTGRVAPSNPGTPILTCQRGLNIVRPVIRNFNSAAE